MYFESRFNSIVDMTEINDFDVIAKKIKSLPIGHGIKIGHQVWINDANPSGTGGHEVAVLCLSNDRYSQFESITVGWCNDLKIKNFLTEYNDLEHLEKHYKISSRRAVKLNDKNQLVWFTCGCCYEDFKSTIALQSKYDQDAGYGICNVCIDLFTDN